MQNIYRVRKDGESLVARLIENGDRSIELTYINQKGDSQVGIYRNGVEVSTKATHRNGLCPIRDSEGKTSLSGYLRAYEELGPELRKQIPSDWHAILGRWLAPKKK